MTAAIKPPPGWQDRLDALLAIYERARNELPHVRGMRALVCEQKIRVAYRQLQALLALRPPVRTIPREQVEMFGALERQIADEAARQRAIAPSNDNGTGAIKQEG